MYPRQRSESDYASDDASAGSDLGADTDTDDAVSGGLPISVAQPTPSVGGRVWDARDDEWPAQSFTNVSLGLSKPNWMVYPRDNARLLNAVARLHSLGDVSTHRRVSSTCRHTRAAMRTYAHVRSRAALTDVARVSRARRADMEEFLREHLPETFTKCLEEGAMHGWGPHIHADILDACVALMSALRARLGSLGPGAEADELDLVPMLATAAAALDWTMPYHQKHKAEPLPQRVAAQQADEWPESRVADEPVLVRHNPKCC